jgi:signal transduction histidine kinase
MKLLIILFLCILPLHASKNTDVTWYIDSYYQDVSNDLNINDIFKLEKQNKFQHYTNSENVFSKGYTKDTYWIKVLIHNATASNARRDFQLDNSWLDEVDMYLVQDTHIISHWINGDKRIYKPSNNKSLHPNIQLNIPNGKSILYIKVSTEEAFIVPFTIDTTENISQSTLLKLSFMAALYATIFIMALYHLFLFFYSRDKNYLFYTLFMFIFILTNSSYSGFQYQLFLHDSLSLPSFLNALYIFTYQYIGVLFVMSFLETKRTMPKIHRILLSFLAINISIHVVTYILGLTHLMQTIAVISMTIFGPMLLAISLYALKNNSQSNRLFALGIFFSLIGSTVTALCAHGILPYTFLYFHAVEFGFIIDAVLISLALASKLKHISNQLLDTIGILKEKEVQIQKEIHSRLVSERISYENSKLANLGEMIGNIAHQWRQPLAQLSYINAFLQEHLTNKDEKVILKLQKTDNIIGFMSDTLNNFQNFYINDNTETNFKPSDVINTVLDLTRHSIELNSIKIILDIDSTLTIYGNKNLYAQVVLALIQNSATTTKERNIQNPFIHISLKQENLKSRLNIEDNAEGIKVVPAQNIFSLFVKTPESSSMGIGLYMSKKIIVEKFCGTIEVQNTADGALFIVVV